MCMEIPVIVLDQEGEVAFWSKLVGAGWVALDIWPVSNSQFYRKLPSWKISTILTDPAYSFSCLPPTDSFSVSIYLTSLSCSYSLCLEWDRCQDSGWWMPSFPIFPLWMKKIKCKRKLISKLCWNRTDNCTITERAQERLQQSKAMARMGRGTLPKGILEGLEGHYKHTACQPLYLVAGHHLSKITLLVLGGGKNYDFVPMSEYTHLHKSSILFGG